jgi:hypothetical protein
MKSVGCTPQSLPPVPDCTTHPLWQSWDIACEMCLMHVSALNKGAAMTDPLNNIPLGKTPKSANPADAAGSANPSQLTGSGTVPGLVADAATTSLVVQRSTFFTDHLTAFEIWLDFEAGSGDSPALLPIVLQSVCCNTLPCTMSILVVIVFVLPGSAVTNPQVACSVAAEEVFVIGTASCTSGAAGRHLPVHSEVIAQSIWRHQGSPCVHLVEHNWI